MDVRLSSEQRALRDFAARAVERSGLKAVTDLADADRAARLDAVVESSGWRELRSADKDGAEVGAAPLASAVETALVAEELARGLADAPFLGATLAAELRRMAGAAAATAPETVLFSPDLSGLAVLSGGTGLPGGTLVPAKADGVAVDARNAPAALALIAAPEGALLASVPLGELAPHPDLTRPFGFPAAQAVPVPGARPLSAAGLDAWTALGLALTCADLVGVMRGAVRMAQEYASVRSQYGRLIGSFQAVQHMLADAWVATEGSRSIALHAAWAVDALPPGEALAAASAAKAYCARAALGACETVIQVHGGIGNTWDCLAHVYLRRAILSADLLGGVGPSLQRVLAHHGIGHDAAGGSPRGLW
jgi:alkylation response protein AidB-like acyl-CoA dehydrogenase